MADRSLRNIIQDAVSGELGIPEFQREFEWKQEKVATLFDSLYENLPIGLVTVWKTNVYNEPQRVIPSGRIPLWLVDGQQRIISFCILFGSKPYWMNDNQWDRAFKNRIYLNIYQDGEANIGRLSKIARKAIPIDELIHKTATEALEYVQEKCSESGILQSKNGCNLAVNALSILDRVIPVAEVGNDKSIEDVAEIFTRLNRQGTQLRQAQIMLAWVSQHNLGWIRDHFYPFLQDLRNKGDWELDPAHILQVATILVEGKARVGQASEEMWKSGVVGVWDKLRDAIEEVQLQLWEKGITDQNMVPSNYTLIPLFAIHKKFKGTPGYSFDELFKWFVLANLSSRYGGAPLQNLATDGLAIFEASNFEEALQNLTISWSQEELHELISDKFRNNSSQALLLHVLLWSAQAKDWVEKYSIPALTQAPKKLEPQWHHIIPQAWGKQNEFEDYDTTPNVTLLCAKTNVRKLSSKPPWEYVQEFSISKEALVQHLVPEKYADKFVKGQPLSRDEFKGFLKEREELIVKQAASLLGV